MKRSKYTEETIIGILKERQGGMTVADLTRKYGVSEQSIYRWQAKYGGMEVSECNRCAPAGHFIFMLTYL